MKEKEGLVGKFVTEFFNGIKPFALEEVDIAPAVGSVFAVKNEEEKERVRRAGNTCRRLMKSVFVPEMEAILRSSRKVKHSKIAEKVGIPEDVHCSWKQLSVHLRHLESNMRLFSLTFVISQSFNLVVSTV